MARRAFLHVGTAKSGTSYLQDLWWRHRDELGDRGLLLPGRRRRDHFTAAALVKGMTAVVDDLGDRDRDVWDRLVQETRAWPGDVLVSNEHFADSPADAAAAALADLASAAAEVHVLVTARDLGRVLPSAWQQRVKMGARMPYRKFLGSVRREDGDQKFWRYQDVPGILDVWSAGVPGERVHVVVVPAPGAPRDELWLRTASVLGLDVTGLDTAALRPNDSLGVVEAELLRRINDAVPRDRRSLAYSRHVKGTFVPTALVGSAPRDSFALPDNHVAWIEEAGATAVAALRSSSYDLVGDVDDLLPAVAPDGRTPDQVSEAELLAAAATVLARLDLGRADSLGEALDALAGHLLSVG
ncbi:hypothetical protein EUA06_09395 [Nocardioides glacieisoli]|uniref:Sulfotransferase family protein n=1 Tax=Nocardioides glacieisoli TaxID=1168730 RepID=A0A4Q2RUJ7_9ACTN|nr:hypothetical protein [Nocardioides glacieisoli]RYB91525.1 hypothetical protein EUA06_09395 [Nocardioides glacieisoli]